jgi:uncharacterized protein (TIGR00369 family)
MKEFKSVKDSVISISQLMLPSHTNFSGKIHGGYIMSLLDQVAFASASKFSENYCVTASVDTINFLNPIEVGELVTLKASVNYTGKSSMIVGIRVESENIRTGTIKHCNSSYFTMVAKNDLGKNCTVPGLILSNLEEVRRYYNCLKMIENKAEKKQNKDLFDHKSEVAIQNLINYNVQVNL